MNRSEKKELCLKFFDELSKELSERYEIIGSCNQDVSAYLIPKGTIEQLSYYGKPALSFRISDHWNWYSSLKKCSDPFYIQCFSVNMPWPRRRDTNDEYATKPRYGWQIALYGNDGKYHHVFGEKFNRRNKEWVWEERTIKDVISLLGSI